MVKTNKHPEPKQTKNKKIKKYMYILGVLALLLVTFVTGRYVYDRSRVLNTEKKLSTLHESLLKSIIGDKHGPNKQKAICLRNTNKFDYVLKETCEYSLTTEINDHTLTTDDTKKYLYSSGYVINTELDIATRPHSTKDYTLLYAANVQISTTSSCIVSVYQAENSTTNHTLETRCITDVIFSPYRVENV